MKELDSVAAEAYVTVLKRLRPSQRRAIIERILADETLAPDLVEISNANNPQPSGVSSFMQRYFGAPVKC